MSNETDLDWLALNAHVWPCGKHQPWCYVVTKIDGERTWASNVLSSSFPYSLVDKDQWLTRRAELQNKPSWDAVPNHANWLTQDAAGTWLWHSSEPECRNGMWIHSTTKGYAAKGFVLGDWRDTLEKRPEQDEFEPFTSIEDNQEQEMKQDNGWFERGELPPVGVVCEAYIDRPSQWIEAEIVAHKDGFAIGWCKSVMKGCHGDKASEFRPIRTEREVLISVIIDEMNRYDTDAKLADAILAAGFKLEVK